MTIEADPPQPLVVVRAIERLLASGDGPRRDAWWQAGLEQALVHTGSVPREAALSPVRGDPPRG